MEAKREDVRLDEEITVIAHSAYNEEGLIIPCLHEFELKVRNLSATGAAIISTREFTEKSSFLIEMELGGEIIKLVPLIVRKTKGQGKEWIYGCKFMHLNPNEERIIRKYIFDNELKRRKMGENNENSILR